MRSPGPEPLPDRFGFRLGPHPFSQNARAVVRGERIPPVVIRGIFIPRGRDVKYPRGMQSHGMKMSGISRASGA